ncbi:MAG: Cardiolipin synthase B [Paracidovorax wautersii]|uniref:Cardiolipin synthase B n=1 Tax=Paracidovorax wautersii TaxID=1177982 RepID=A0A7V8FSX3_9BURK|nr:MAG: Cardiolipin synthase B [Paracidovorax wautersii]
MDTDEAPSPRPGLRERWRRKSAPSRWTAGNAFELLENGEAYFPAVNAALARARREVVIETFILFEDKVGLALHAQPLAAAQRGVDVHLLVDGYGSFELSPDFIGSLIAAGVQLRVFDPGQKVMGQRLNVLRRMHRKIVVVDGELAFIGGINFSADHLADWGPLAKQDYATAVRGPLVRQIRDFVFRAIDSRPRPDNHDLGEHTERGDMHALFVTRDNHRHATDIERHYQIALRAARQRVVIANAYFFPGYRFIRSLRRAALRGVDVRLILQGEPDMPIVKTAARLLYDHLLRAGVKIYEYSERPLHGKVALVDDAWATIGSSNLDPLSLSLNLEANVVVRDRAFNQTLHERLDHLMRHGCQPVQAPPEPRWNGLRLVRSYCVFHVLRWFPTWAGWLPRHRPTITLAQAEAARKASDRDTPASAST